MGRTEFTAEQELQPQAQPQPQAYPPQAQPHLQAYPPQAQPQPQTYPPPQYPPPPVPAVQYPPQRPTFPNAGPINPHNSPVQYPLQSPGPDPVKPVQFPPMPQPGPLQYPPNSPTQMMGQAQQAQVGYTPHQPVQYPQAGYYGMQTKENVAQGVPMPGSQMGPTGQVGSTDNWRTGLFDCMNDPTNAIITCFFPCFTFGQIAEILDNGNTTCATSGLIYGVILALIYAPCVISCSYRTRLRNKFNLPEAPAPDWITHCIFEHCALCQEYRELQLRGIDPAIGWHANVARNPSLAQQQSVMAPPMNQRMMG